MNQGSVARELYPRRSLCDVPDHYFSIGCRSGNPLSIGAEDDVANVI